MLGFLKKLFLTPEARAKLDNPQRARPGPAKSPAGSAGQNSASKEQAVKDAMAVYRRQRKEYENLDAETRAQIEADAAKAFGSLGTPPGKKKS